MTLYQIHKLTTLYLIVQNYRERNAFIVTQAPLESTVTDFWRMMWETKSASIVMLTELQEGDEVRAGRGQVGVVRLALFPAVGDVCQVLAVWCGRPQCVWWISGRAE